MNGRPLTRWIWLLLLVAASAGLVGCKTAEPENVSPIPWGRTQTWEHGFPGGMGGGGY
jgi:hypothetical protein